MQRYRQLDPTPDGQRERERESELVAGRIEILPRRPGESHLLQHPGVAAQIGDEKALPGRTALLPPLFIPGQQAPVVGRRERNKAARARARARARAPRLAPTAPGMQ